MIVNRCIAVFQFGLPWTRHLFELNSEVPIVLVGMSGLILNGALDGLLLVGLVTNAVRGERFSQAQR